MQYGILGTGSVGQTLASKLVSLGYKVMLGSREKHSEKALIWVHDQGHLAHEGSFADAAHFGEILINATNGTASLTALHAAGAENLLGKILLDVSNPLDFSEGIPPTLSVSNTSSLAEQIQWTFPHTYVVKALNTVNHAVMVNPGLLPEEHTLFICGNNGEAKASIITLLERFGWPFSSILDLGDITNARGMEMYLPLWLRIAGAVHGKPFNIKVVKAE